MGNPVGALAYGGQHPPGVEVVAAVRGAEPAPDGRAGRAQPVAAARDRASRGALVEGRGTQPRGVYGQPADRDLIRRFHDAGATRVVVRPTAVDSEAAMSAELTKIAEAVLR